jgi:hypothetical protein
MAKISSENRAVQEEIANSPVPREGLEIIDYLEIMS